LQYQAGSSDNPAMPLEKVRKLFISPHNDDETLFGAFTIQRERPHVLVVFDSFVQVARGDKNCDAITRRHETCAAVLELLRTFPSHHQPLFAGVRDDFDTNNLGRALRQIDDAIFAHLEVDLSDVEEVWYPSIEIPAGAGHPHHDLVSMVAGTRFEKAKKTRYLTYARGMKSREGERVPFDGAMLRRKLKALACYTSQLNNPTTIDHFWRDQREYYERPSSDPTRDRAAIEFSRTGAA
jgi:LmbE family N-acetylglucosaminyl deacetylase